MSERKFLPGPSLNIHQLVDAVLDGEYVMDNGKPQHPSFMLSRQFRDLTVRCRRGLICAATPNPKHPDNAERTQ